MIHTDLQADTLAAPQANAMAAGYGPINEWRRCSLVTLWYRCSIGFRALLSLKFPALAFALGMFIPLKLKPTGTVGGAVNWYVTTRSKDEAVNNARNEQEGTLLASVSSPVEH